ncbi:hypothetical protein B0O80DRAFT_57448 [Mortierella sp. GBAus27b]|nr:hypothetical protein BGX31_004335 [Mortierella sp. GBA43]KAI8354365.1 hypothetical protein B0O80DRAFT_57448 [Mortierella sp. GBAus27b]
MLPRVRQWEPIPLRKFEALPTMSLNAALKSQIRYLETEFADSGGVDTIPLISNLIVEDIIQNEDLAYYDPFMGNLCAVGQFVGLPVIATPDGPGGSDLAITLAMPKPHQEPCFNFLAPKSALLSFPSPICQIATTPLFSGLEVVEEQVVVRTRESVTVVTPSSKVPSAISRINPSHINIAADISSTPPSCTDKTIHVSISPYSPNTYALVGDKGRIALWTPPIVTPTMDTDGSASGSESNDNDSQEGEKGIRDGHNEGDRYQAFQPRIRPLTTQSLSDIFVVRKELAADDFLDPWRRCTWSAHPSQVVFASRRRLDLIDFRGPSSSTILFEGKDDEKIQAIQEGDRLRLAPFQTYIATSRQIACIDQRFTKRPVVSWAHQMDRGMPCGIMAMDLVSNDSNHSTVITWSKRNAEILAYNTTLGSSDLAPGFVTLNGRAQELPSFHLHAQYTNTNKLRDPLKRWESRNRSDGIPQHGAKPPLLGLAVLPTSILQDEEDPDSHQIITGAKSKSISRFSLLQYAFTGAIYAQDLELKMETDRNNQTDALISVDEDGSLTDAASGNYLSSEIARQLAKSGIQDEEVIDMLIESGNINIAHWKHDVQEAEQVDESIVGVGDLMPHVDLDLKRLLNTLKVSLLEDRADGESDADLESMLASATQTIRESFKPVTMFEIFEKIDCNHWSVGRRSVLAQAIQDKIERHPEMFIGSGRDRQSKVMQMWPKIGLEIDNVMTLDSLDAIIKYLEDLYRLPEVIANQDQEDKEQHPSITSQLANLSIPGDQSSSLVNGSADHDRPESQEWPTEECRLIRRNAIHRLAYELKFSCTVITKTSELEDETERISNMSETKPQTVTAQTPEPEATASLTPWSTTLGRLRQQGGGNRVKVRYSSRAKAILDDWNVGENPNDYTFVLSDVARDQLREDEQDEEETNVQYERMTKLRRKREERERQAKAIRKADTDFLNNLTKSASLPGLPTSGFNSEVDDDGEPSLPTVFSASQPVSMSKVKPSGSKSLKQTKMTSVRSKKQMSLSQPADMKKERRARSPLSSSQDLFGSASFADTEVWEATLEVEDYNMDETYTEHVSVSQSYSQSQSQTEILSQSQDAESMWGASQPVQGRFANRVATVNRGSGSGGKTKKKTRSQGF